MTTLVDVIQSYLNEAEMSNHQMMRFLEIAKRGVMDLHMNLSGLPVTRKLEFNSDTLTSPLPTDYISYRRVGYLASGVIVPFAYNPRIKLYPPDGACLPENQNAGITSINPGIPFNVDYPYYWGPWNTSVGPNGVTGGFSNMGGSAAYYCDFTIDELNGYVQYGSNPQVDIYMEYLGNPKKVEGNYVVHPFDIQALIAWIAWRDVANKKGVSKELIRDKRGEYFREVGQARKRHYGYTISTAYQMIRQTNKATAQF